MRVLVTGGAGFIGSHIVEAALAAGHEVAVLDNLSTGHRENVPSAARLFEVDLRDRDATAAAVAEFRPEAVSHQAAQASVPNSVRDPHTDAQVNVIGGLNLLDACTKAGASVERLVFASTGGAIYGEVPESTSASESTPPNPQSPYAIHKSTFEQLLGVYRQHRGLKSTVLRYANVYGPRQDPFGEAGVVAIFIDSVLAGREIFINGRSREGDDGCVRDYVYVSDVARLNLMTLSGAVADSVVNVGTGVGVSTHELAAAIVKLSQREVALRGRPPRIGDLERSVLDATRTKRYLGDTVKLAEGLAHTLASYAARPGSGSGSRAG
jgi:UDP-glucose 4-epimerase